MKIKLLCCTLLCIMHIHGMQNVVDNPEKQQAEHIIVNMMSSSEEQPVIGEKKDGVVEKIGNLMSGNSESQNNNSRIDASARSSQDPHLNLNSSMPLRRYQTATIENQPINQT